MGSSTVTMLTSGAALTTTHSVAYMHQDEVRSGPTGYSCLMVAEEGGQGRTGVLLRDGVPIPQELGRPGILGGTEGRRASASRSRRGRPSPNRDTRTPTSTRARHSSASA